MTSALFIYLSWQIIKPAGEKTQTYTEAQT